MALQSRLGPGRTRREHGRFARGAPTRRCAVRRPRAGAAHAGPRASRPEARRRRAHRPRLVTPVAIAEPRGRPGATGRDARTGDRGARTESAAHAADASGEGATTGREAAPGRDQAAPARGRRLTRATAREPSRGARPCRKPRIPPAPPRPPRASAPSSPGSSPPVPRSGSRRPRVCSRWFVPPNRSAAWGRARACRKRPTRGRRHPADPRANHGDGAPGPCPRTDAARPPALPRSSRGGSVRDRVSARRPPAGRGPRSGSGRTVRRAPPPRPSRRPAARGRSPPRPSRCSCPSRRRSPLLACPTSGRALRGNWNLPGPESTVARTGRRLEGGRVLAASGFFLLFRPIHIIAGALWFGSAFLFSLFIGPAAAKVGPAAGPLLHVAIKERKAAMWITILAVVSVLAGWLMWLYHA